MMARQPSAWIVALGSVLPARYAAAEEAEKAGHDISDYRGWPYYHRAGEDEHPSQMGAAALRIALDKAGLHARDLDFLFFTGMSRDFLPSWSVATEIVQLLDATCVGLDLTMGCLGMVMGLETAAGWMAVNPKRQRGAIVCAERWAYTVDREDPSKEAMWAHSDGAAAMVVARDPGQSAVAGFEGLSLTNLPEMNGFVKIKYGGTRFPRAEGDAPHQRILRGDAKRELFPKYMNAFGQAIDACRESASVPLRTAVCNQISPSVVSFLQDDLDLPGPAIPRTGEAHGHVGGCDAVLGLEGLLQGKERLQEPTFLLASSPYTFSAAPLIPGR